MVRREVLPNGLRILTETITYVQSVSIGIWVASGSRDETHEIAGISHFIEHMYFKGTETRTARQIADEFDSIGGQLNAFTDKEYTCYFCKVLCEHLPHALNVLSDMFLNSTLATQEIELEKNVILEEIKRHEDTPEEQVHDLVAEIVWEGHPLGKSILGNEESVENLTRDNLVEFTGSRYSPDSIIISAAGNLVHEELVEQINRLFGDNTGSREKLSEKPPIFTNESRLTTKTTEQVHLCIGTKGYSQVDQNRYDLAIIDATLGGGMSSRLFQEIRENRGLVYAIGSYSASYRDGGMFAIYGGTSMENIEEVVNLIRAEFKNIVQGNITDDELTRAKNQIRAALVLSEESMSSRMSRMAKTELYFGRLMPIEEIISCVQNVTHESVARAANDIFGDSQFPIAAIGPFNDRKVVICQ